MDFVIDSCYRPWLLEVNLSPALNKRTPYMSSMLRHMADGLIGIVTSSRRRRGVHVDDAEGQRMQPPQSHKQRWQVDTKGVSSVSTDKEGGGTLHPEWGYAVMTIMMCPTM